MATIFAISYLLTACSLWDGQTEEKPILPMGEGKIIFNNLEYAVGRGHIEYGGNDGTVHYLAIHLYPKGSAVSESHDGSFLIPAYCEYEMVFNIQNDSITNLVNGLYEPDGFDNGINHRLAYARFHYNYNNDYEDFWNPDGYQASWLNIEITDSEYTLTFECTDLWDTLTGEYSGKLDYYDRSDR